MTDTKQHVTASATAVTDPNFNNQPRLVEVPPDRPGIVIFLHGVNDPGATYQNVERGICEGLNWRLNRTDLAAGEYGAAWREAKQKQAEASQNQTKLTDADKAVVYDPDTHLYRRTDTEKTNSVFIPFYWGYRAANGEIAKDRKGNPIKLRSQHQDAKGNRLDAHFAKEGGYFDNATNNIPDMYGKGFELGAKEHAARHLADRYTYIGESPMRLYFVLAAHRLAMLIRQIREASTDQGTGDETITVIGHSQGTIITLLAQAILAKENARLADNIIMVDSPYAVWENDDEKQTSQAKLKTFANIVEAVTGSRHQQPALTELACTDQNPKHRGRTGPKWSPTQGVRPLGTGGANTQFDERDNRGKVYLYFCTDDTVVGLDNIRGIGTYGMPNSVTAVALGSTASAWAKFVQLAAMDAFKKAPGRFAFYQRLWTKLKRDGKPVLVGLAPQTVTARTPNEPRFPGGSSTSAAAVTQHPYRTAWSSAPVDGSLDRWINGEQIDPPYAPSLFGGETRDKRGNPSGQLPVDAVGVNVALGNPDAEYDWKLMKGIPSSVVAQAAQQKTQVTSAAVVKQWYNSQQQDENDQTSDVSSLDGVNFMRRETPNEVRARLTGKDATDNNYHSGILNDAANVRAIAAMDVAIGQAKTLDDPDWRETLIAFADWRTDWTSVPSNVKDCYKKKLSADARKLVDATYRYYASGEFPDEDLVPRTWPTLVKSQTHDERARSKNDPGVVA
ncbi:T6SS effector phospholipase Tle3 domain-containing protein [Paraburkholderia phenoliruptrix]|uniref:T6SS effector phospholipase Tle3 domain-containing protein n=1 Tax=Paraburkholderia phenoliruptrix TaxID=252970 RepID=UPI002869E4D1|nr:DUF3274 domain-containing protein [Paraburkholderia phenoliruptrix]WMY08000.1 DUF3274 domain-containing protein [Paraburkholderia phenoliruptrix]